MRWLGVVLVVCLSQGLFAFHVDFIKQDDENYKKLKVSSELTAKAGEEGKFLATIKVVANFNHSLDVSSYLLNNGKRVEVKRVIKDNLATVTFEVNKNDLEKAELHFSYPNGAGCPPMYAVKLNELTSKN